MAETCPRCTEPVDGHTVAALRTCLSELHDHVAPFEPIPMTSQDIACVTAGSIAVRAGVHDSALGTHPVLVFDFATPDGPIAPIALVLDVTHMRSVRTLVGSAIDAAVKAARKHRGRS